MKKSDLFLAFNDVDDDVLERSEVAACDLNKKNRWQKRGALAACFCLILAVLAALPGVLNRADNVLLPSNTDVFKPGVNNYDNPYNASSSQPVEPSHVQDKDTRAETWLTAGELGVTSSEGLISAGFCVPTFITYQGGFYGSVSMDQVNSLRFARSEHESVRFNVCYTHHVYLVEDHPDWIAIHINGMEVYQKIFDVTFDVDGTPYAIAYSPVMNADYGLGDVVLETGDYTVYEAIRLQGEPTQIKEYIVDILPTLQRERPNIFDGSYLEPDGYYFEQWQLALPLE